MLFKKLMLCAVLALAAANFVNAQSTPRDVRDLVGARASSGETQLTRRGYKFIKTTEGDDRKWSNYWKNSTKTCITVATVNGRYNSITKTPEADCSTGDSSGSGDSLDVSDLVGARASSGESQLRQRGYRFIKSEKGEDRIWSNWWNRSTSTCITVATVSGRYDSITKTPEADCTPSNGNGGNGGGMGGGATAKVDVSDLVGARASSGESEMKTRGFRLVDTMKSGNSSYTIWWRQPSRQCIQVATAEGRYDSLTDIQTHPNCR